MTRELDCWNLGFSTISLAYFTDKITSLGFQSQISTYGKVGFLSVLLSLGIVVFTLATVIYRLYFHPLSAYPGPILAKITDWYSVYHCYIGDRHLDFYRLHYKYGDVVRYGPNRTSINTINGLNDIYGVNANVQKSRIHNAFLHFFKAPMSMITVDRKEHAFKRRVNTRALTVTAIKSLEHLLLKNINIFCQKMLDDKPLDGWSRARDVSKWSTYLTSDIMGTITFSRNWNVMESDQNRKVVEALPEGVAGLITSGHMPGILTFKLDKLLFRSLIEQSYRFQSLSKAQAEWRIKQGNNPDLMKNDIFSALQEAKDPETGRRYTQKELISEAGLLIIAGSDTTATAISATVFYLLHSPSILLRLQQEILRTFSSVEEIRLGSQLSSCVYLTACIDEAMRLSPPVPGLLPREVLSGGLVLNDLCHSLPAGTDTGVPIYALHHNEKYFPEPFIFRPERWIIQDNVNTASDVQRARAAFCAFGIGRTSCVGKQLAYAEMELVLAKLIWKYEIRLKLGDARGEGRKGRGWGRDRKDEFQLWDKFVSTSEGPMVEFKQRQRSD